MKSRLIFFIFCFTQTALADFIKVSNDYASGHYDAAFKGYQQLASLGNDRAKYNIAVMYLKGQGVETDLIKAYAWNQLVDHSQLDGQPDLSEGIESALNPEQLKQAGELAAALSKHYGETGLMDRLNPILITDSSGSKNKDYQLEIRARKAPRFPKQSYLNGTQGWVRVGFDVHPDGSTRNHYVMESVPEGEFDDVTIEAVQGFKFDLAFDDGVKPRPIQVTQTIQFAIPNQDESQLAKMYQERMDKLKALADQNHPTAQYYYGLAGNQSSMVNDYLKMSQDEGNTWLLRAAKNGQLDAQFQLGMNLFSGRGCQVDNQKGINWILNAAQQGHAKAARQAYRALTQFDVQNNSGHPAEYWLKMSADNGDPESQLVYAEHLAFSTANDQIDTGLIREYLAQYLKQRDRSVQWYQTMAQVNHLEGNQKKAAKFTKKAEKLARKLGWETP